MTNATRWKAASLFAAAALALGTALPANAVQTVFSATMKGSTEAVPNNSTATGLALVTFDDVALTVTVNEIFLGLNGGGATGGHIHCCTTTPGVGSSPIYVPFTNFPTTATAAYNNVFTLSSASFATLLAGTMAGQAYVNVHDATFPAGEISGFLVAVVPEPESLALMAAGLGAVGLVARRRRTA
jgi:hypothetical protein